MKKYYEKKMKHIKDNDPRLKGYLPWKDKALTKREAALATKEMFPDVAATRVADAIGWKQYSHWVLDDDARDKKQERIRNAQEGKREYIKKIKLELGGCQICGYIKCFSALEFHHKDPNAKEAGVTQLHKIEDIKREVSKCILLCSNCHREVHEGITSILFQPYVGP